MKTIFYFTYKTTNLTRKEKGLIPYLYLGQHCTNNLDDGYCGSSKELKSHIKKGDKCEREIIEFYNNIYDLGNAEHKLLQEHHVNNNEIFYNKAIILFYNHRYNKKLPSLSEEHKAKLSAAGKGRKIPNDIRLKISTSLKGRSTGPKSEEHKAKISASNKGKHSNPLTEEHKVKLSVVGKGRVFTEEHKSKLSASKKGKKYKTKKHQ